MQEITQEIKPKKNTAVKTTQAIVTAILLLTLGALAGYYFGISGYEVNIKKEVRVITIDNKENKISDSVDFADFWAVWEEINAKHINRPLDPEILLDGAIHGMVDAIGDPYTSFLNIEQNEFAQSSLNGKYEGIGAQLGFDDNDRLIIVAPLDGSPAEATGVRAGDMIVQIEGEDTYGISVTEAVNKIRGEAGTISTLTMFRDGLEEPFEVKILRDTITIDSVTWEDKGGGVAYIRLSRFGGTTNQEWAQVVSEIVTQMPNLTGIVLDVRNNPGGYLESSVYIGSEFVKKGVIVTEDFVDGTDHSFTVDHKGRLLDEDVKVVILINGGSASASEIVAGALKEKRDAILVGDRSFGKGTVQKSEEYVDGSALHVTVAKWLTPDGNWIDSHNSEHDDSVYNEIDENGEEIIGGLKPDYVVEFTDEDIENEHDAQLEKALELLGVSMRDEPPSE